MSVVPELGVLRQGRIGMFLDLIAQSRVVVRTDVGGPSWGGPGLDVPVDVALGQIPFDGCEANRETTGDRRFALALVDTL